MTNPEIPQRAPYPAQVEAGKQYWWCACGRSATQPFCDGSHKGTGCVPLSYEPQENATLYFCGCKHSAGKPLCDGSHKKL